MFLFQSLTQPEILFTDYENEHLQKRARLDTVDDFSQHESLLSQEELAPLLNNCVKLEPIDLPFMEVAQNFTEANGLSSFPGQEYSESAEEILDHSTSGVQQSTLSVSCKTKAKSVNSLKRKTVTTEVSLQDPTDDVNFGNPTEIFIAEDVSFIETKE